MKATLTIYPDGHSLLAFDGDLSPDEVERIKAQWELWQTTPQGVAIIANAVVERAETFAIDLPEVAA